MAFSCVNRSKHWPWGRDLGFCLGRAAPWEELCGQVLGGSGFTPATSCLRPASMSLRLSACSGGPETQAGHCSRPFGFQYCRLLAGVRNDMLLFGSSHRDQHRRLLVGGLLYADSQWNLTHPLSRMGRLGLDEACLAC